MIDRQGYRPNVGIILCNQDGQVFWARRTGEDSWQFPQGGIQRDETPEQALYRELREEIGLQPEHVQVIGRTTRWLRYRIPRRFLRHKRPGLFVGQKQLWFLLRLVSSDQHVCLTACDKSEFDSWRWINHDDTVNQVISFKRVVYPRALQELSPLIDCRPTC